MDANEKIGCLIVFVGMLIGLVVLGVGLWAIVELITWITSK